MGKICPKHIELILEINKTVIVASCWFLYYLNYIDDARSNTNQTHIKWLKIIGNVKFLHVSAPEFNLRGSTSIKVLEVPKKHLAVGNPPTRAPNGLNLVESIWSSQMSVCIHNKQLYKTLDSCQFLHLTSILKLQNFIIPNFIFEWPCIFE